MKIESFISEYIADGKPLKELGYFLRKEFKDLSYQDSIIILNDALKTCKRLNIVLNFV